MATNTIVYPQWSTDPWQNTPVNIQEFGQVTPQVCSDTKGGVLVSYLQTGNKIYVQRVDRRGYNMWGDLGAPVCTISVNVHPDPIKIINDDDGNSFVIWKDYRDRTDDVPYYCRANALYIQKIDSSGNELWQTDGIELSPFTLPTNCWTCGRTTHTENIIPDNDGGAYISWNKSNDSLCQSGMIEAFVQHVDSNGNILWDEWGKSMGVFYSGNEIVSDGVGGIYSIAGHVNVVRLDGGGELIWEDTLNISVGFYPDFVPDGNGGIVGGGRRLGGYNDTLMFQRINATGEKLWTDIQFILTGRINNNGAEIYPDGQSGLFVSWILNSSSNFAVFTQRVDSSGNIIFDFPGIASYIDAVDDQGNWFDHWFRGDSNGVLFRDYIQKYNINGEPQWTGEYGTLYKSRAEYWQRWSPRVFAPDNHGGVILVWDETRHMTSYYDIMAQQVNADGQLGEVLVSVDGEDLPTVNPSFDLLPNYPNPFNTETTIKFTVHLKADYKLVIYSITGNEIFHEVFRGLNPGQHEFIWQGTDQFGHELSSGIYLTRLSSQGKGKTNKLILIK